MIQAIVEYSRRVVVRLIVLAVAMIVVATVVRVVILSNYLKSDIQALSAAHQLSIATYVAQDIDGKVRARLDLLRRLAERLPAGHLTAPDQLRAWLRDRHEINALFSNGLMVVSTNGAAIAAFPEVAGRMALDYQDSDWFIAARAGESRVVGKPFRGRATGAPLIIMASPIKGTNGEVAAVLAGVTDLSSPGFLDLVQQAKIGETGGFLLISPQDKLFVAATNPAMVLKSTPAPGVNLLHDRAMAGYRGSGVTVNASGIEELSAMVSVPSTGWFLVARLPTAEAFQAVHRVRAFIVRNSLLIVPAVSLILAFVLRRFFRPLSNAASEIGQMAEGKVPLHPLAVIRRDEIGELAVGFNFLLEKLQENEARMAHMAHHDALTGLPNRALLNDRLEQAIVRAERTGGQFALLFMDLDGFKPINDSHGHEVGDAVLRQVAGRLKDAVRRLDTVARFGGDEFVVILHDLDAPQEATSAMAGKLLDAMVAPVQVGGLALSLGLSIGSAIYPDDGRNANALLSRADQAMYRGKRAGGGCHHTLPA